MRKTAGCPLPQHRSIAEPGGLEEIPWHPRHRSRFPRSSLCLQITNYCGSCHSPSAGLSRNTRSKKQQKCNKSKKANTTPETAQNAASAFIYHSNPNIVLAMSHSPRKCWAQLGKLWVRNALHMLQQPRRGQSSGMDWSYSRVKPPQT